MIYKNLKSDLDFERTLENLRKDPINEGLSEADLYRKAKYELFNPRCVTGILDLPFVSSYPVEIWKGCISG